jgi:hypothetical protein
MFELLIIIPNFIAQLACSMNKAYYSNLIYSFGYLLFIWHNIKIGDNPQLFYFSVMEIMAVSGVIWYIWKNKSDNSLIDKSKNPKPPIPQPRIVGGYQPVGNLDLSNPPKSGTGVPSKYPITQPVKIEYTEDERIELTWN